VLSTTDPNVTVTTAGASFGPIAVAEDGYAQTPFGISVSGGCPDPHVASMRLVVTSSDFSADTVDFPLNITATPGCYDNMEFGQHGWAHSGILDGWHLSTYRSVSPSHSWYCGNDGSHQYTNENDARLMTPLYTVGDSTTMHFQQWYNTEANYDYCVVEVGNGSLFWLPLAQYTGYAPNWQLASFNLARFRGQTVQLRFRFISDYNGTGEGWYIDDFWSGALTGVAEAQRAFGPSLSTARNPVRDRAELRFALPAGSKGRVGVYDRAGRLVKWLLRGATGSGRADWNLTDGRGCAVPDGAYFVRLTSDRGAQVVKLLVAR